MHEKQTAMSTVQFNVGGKIYMISESLLQKYPDTLLAHNHLLMEGTTTASPMFFDRDPDRFAYCLDYMRRDYNNGAKVYLPETVSKKAVLQELKFLGFTNIDEECFVEDDSASKTAAKFQKILAESYGRMAFQEEEITKAQKNISQLQNQIQDRNADIAEHRLQIQLEQCALRCFKAGVDTKNVEFHVALNTNEVQLLTPRDKQVRFATICNGLGLGEALFNRNQGRVEFKKCIN